MSANVAAGPVGGGRLPAVASGAPSLDTIHCTDALTLLRALPDGCVDMIFIDPPFGHNNNNGDLIQRWEAALVRPRGAGSNPRPIANDGVEANEIFKACLPHFKRILKPGCCCCCCCCGGGPDPQFARWSLWMDEVLTYKQMIIWDKGPMGMGWHYRRSYETVLVASKGDCRKWFDETHTVENIIRPGDYGIRKIIPTGNDHPTPKPIELAEFFINLHSQPGDLILDCFSGGGSTLLAAKKLGRHFIGCDIDAQWVNYARERLAQSDPFQPRRVSDTATQLALFETVK